MSSSTGLGNRSTLLYAPQENAMQMPLQITFRNMEPSAAVEERVR